MTMENEEMSKDNKIEGLKALIKESKQFLQGEEAEK
jgi:hypothetical protein